MRTYAALLVSVAVALTGCSGDDGPTTAEDPASSSDRSTPPPAAVPAAPGQVRTRVPATVMDTGGGPELCLGPVAESYPPQCGGPEIVGWDWAEQEYAERRGAVRWGTFVVTGTWDGTAFTVDDAVPGALYDPVPETPADLLEPSVDLDDTELDAIASEIGDTLPGAQGAYADGEGHVLVDVTYDDGSLQYYADATYGVGVVAVTGALVDV